MYLIFIRCLISRQVSGVERASSAASVSARHCREFGKNRGEAETGGKCSLQTELSASLGEAGCSYRVTERISAKRLPEIDCKCIYYRYFYDFLVEIVK